MSAMTVVSCDGVFRSRPCKKELLGEAGLTEPQTKKFAASLGWTHRHGKDFCTSCSLARFKRMAAQEAAA